MAKEPTIGPAIQTAERGVGVGVDVVEDVGV